MSAPTTPQSIALPAQDTASHPSRPFSPSPPRENIHTASRPPSLFLGAAVPASPSLSDSRSFNIFGLPGTPEVYRGGYDGMPRHEIAEDIFGFGGREQRSRKTSRVGQPGEVDRTTVTAELAATRDSLTMVRSMSSGSLSSTSSSSPPLGSASILATLANNADSDNASLHTSSLGRRSGRTSGFATPPDRFDISGPRTPQSARPSRVSMPNPSALSNSNSMPRLQQPTVVRSTSGRVVSFVPPPGRAVSTKTSSLGRPHKSRASMSPRSSLTTVMGESEESERERKYHSFSGGEGSRPRPMSYLSDLGPPIHFPTARPSVGSYFSHVAQSDKAAADTTADDKAAASMLEKGVIQVGGEASGEAAGHDQLGADDTLPGLDHNSGGTSERSTAPSRGEERAGSSREGSVESDTTRGHKLFYRNSIEQPSPKEAGAPVFTPFQPVDDSSSGRISPNAQDIGGGSTDGAAGGDDLGATDVDQPGEAGVIKAQMPGGKLEGKGGEEEVADGPVRGDPSSREGVGAEEFQAAQTVDIPIGEKQQSTEEEVEPVEKSQTSESKEDEVAKSSVASVEEKQESDRQDNGTIEDMSALGAKEARAVQSSDVPVGSAVIPVSKTETTVRVQPASARSAVLVSAQPRVHSMVGSIGESPAEPAADRLLSPLAVDQTSTDDRDSHHDDATETEPEPSAVPSPAPHPSAATGADRPVPLEDASVSAEDGDQEAKVVETAAVEREEADAAGSELELTGIAESKPRSSLDTVLNEITDDEVEAAQIPSELISNPADAQPSDGTVYIPPYAPRKSAPGQTYRLTTASSPPPADEDKFAVTLLAGIARQSRSDPLSLTIPHVELYLAWSEPRSWLWVPARKYIPSFNLHLVPSGKEVVLRDQASEDRAFEAEMRRGIVRGIVKGVVSRLPVVWRLADWV
ncbi:uncharacterized protein MKK02DRAFT_40578 [Dioszegia hungarica]|uniref:Uncharacterized protein n=1 Tax=Dioszegia hungarica TaxID=4972 RepID=A0AA38H0S1_9TREE|nr:uncharacterized protein MKK02DRAFT_40578 [Dioszegia hungarica]KAI9632273.1 hypothetical protein MKK02DRAFT_40578 [Dioszegia hungarica]